MTSDRERYQQLKAQGKCPKCACQLPDNCITAMCQDCRNAQQARRKKPSNDTAAYRAKKAAQNVRRRESRKASRRCVECQVPLAEGVKRICDDCRNRANAYGRKTAKKRYDQAKRFGHCAKHRTREAVPGTVYCAYCAEMRNESNSLSYQRKVQEARDKGQCTTCRVADAAEGYATCDACRERDREARRLRKRKQELLEQGLALIHPGE